MGIIIAASKRVFKKAVLKSLEDNNNLKFPKGPSGLCKANFAVPKIGITINTKR